MGGGPSSALAPGRIPAGARLLDLLIAVRRPEVDRMIDASESRLEGLDLLRVPRVIGRGRVRVALKRYRSVVRILREARSEGRPFGRMVAKQAPIELIAARRAGITATGSSSSIPNPIEPPWRSVAGPNRPSSFRNLGTRAVWAHIGPAVTD